MNLIVYLVCIAAATMLQAEPAPAASRGVPGFPGAKVLQWEPDESVVTDKVLRDALVATKLPWRIAIELPSRVGDQGVETIEMLLVPPGSFIMGQSLGDATALDREQSVKVGDEGVKYYETPAHEVRLTKPFYMSKREINKAVWHAARPARHMGNDNIVKTKYLPKDPSATKRRRDYDERVAAMRAKGMTAQEAERTAGPAPEDPGLMEVVENAQDPVYADPYSLRSFLKIMQSQLKSDQEWIFALPTEAEWEFACRAGTRAPRYAAPRPGKDEVEVANALGLVDMLGGIAEWTADGYRGVRYPDGPVEDPFCSDGKLATPRAQLLRPEVDPIRVYWQVIRGAQVPGRVEGSRAPIASYRQIGQWNPKDSSVDFAGSRAGVRLCLRQQKK